MTDLPTVRSLWVGEKLSAMEKASMSSFLKQGYKYELYVYDEVAGIPSGIVIRNAAKILPRNRIFRYKNTGGLGGFSNLFRYHLLAAKGGWWMDTDIICLKPLPQVADLMVATQIIPKTLVIKPNNCAMFSQPNGDFINFARDWTNDQDPASLSHGDTGPVLMNTMIQQLDRWDLVAPYNMFCPLHWWEAHRLLQPASKFQIPDESVGIHLWNEVWRVNQWNKDKLCKKTSLYRTLTEKHL